MDLPTSGWYPDPYGTSQLLRWWDGSAWTHHTHPDVNAAATTVQPATAQPSARHSADRLSRTRPPSGPPTSPQPALPATTVQPTVQPTPVQPTTVQPGTGPPPTTFQPSGGQPSGGQPSGAQPSGGQPSGAQPSGGQPSGAQPSGGQPGQSGNEGDGSQTQVLFTGPWESPAGDAWQAPGGMHAFGNPNGYTEARRRRRRLAMGGLAVAAAAAIAVVGIIVANLGGSAPTAPTADAVPVPATASATPTAAAAPTVSFSPTAPSSASASLGGAVLSDGQSGLTYTELPTPWQGTACPAVFDSSAFTWTAGEAAVAGTVNGGQNTWYGWACSGPLPLQYNYNGVGDLQNTATTLASTFANTFYNALAHNQNQEASQPVQVSGHAGWEVTYQITYTNAAGQGAAWSDEQAAVVVVDAGTGNTPAVFFTSVPGNLDESNVTSLVSSLQLSAVPSNSASTSPANGGAPSDQASDQASDGSGGNNP